MVHNNNQGKTGCSIHSVSLETLTDAVLEDIQAYARLAVEDEETLLKRLAAQIYKDSTQDLAAKRSKLDEVQKRLAEVETLAQKLFEERTLSNVPDWLFKKMMVSYETEREQLEITIAELSAELSQNENKSENLIEWVDILRKYVIMDSLDRSIITKLIERITVSEAYTVDDGSRQQDIKIFYKFVGSLSI